MKYIITFFFLMAIGLVLSGYFIEVAYSEKLIGAGVVVLFFIVIPLFSWHRWKNRSAKDYLLTKENLDKMRDREKNKL